MIRQPKIWPLTLPTLWVLLVILSACSADKFDPESETYMLKELDCTDHTAWVYFSFEKGSRVILSDAEAETSTGWDIAFRGHYVRTNGGSSGIGLGGAAMAGDNNSDEDFTPDVPRSIVELNKDGKPIVPTKYVEVSLNPLLCRWVSVKPATREYKYEANRDYIVKTAKGSYAKVTLHTFEKGGTPGNLLFYYAYPYRK